MHMVRSNEGTPPARLLSELSSESERLTFLLDPPGIFGSVIYSAFRVHGPTRDGLCRVLDNSWLRQSEGKIEGGGEQRSGGGGEEERVLSGWAVGEQLVGWSKSTCIVVENHH